MRYWIILFFIAFQFQLFGQDYFMADSVPVNDGKVEFNVKIKTDLDKTEIRSRVIKYLNEGLSPYSGVFSLDSTDLTVCQITDYVKIMSNVVNVFAMYMTYSLSFEYQDNECNVKFSNIAFMEKEDFEYKAISEMSGEKRTKIPAFSAEEIMIEKNYKLLFYKKASERVTKSTVERINKIINELEILLYRK